MAISYPVSVILNGSGYQTYTDDGDNVVITNGYCVIPCGSYNSYRPPSFFREEPDGNGHKVCHAKVLSVGFADNYGHQVMLGRFRMTPSRNKTDVRMSDYRVSGKRSYQYSITLSTDYKYTTTTTFAFRADHSGLTNKQGWVQNIQDGQISGTCEYHYDGRYSSRITSSSRYPTSVCNDLLALMDELSYKAVIHETPSTSQVNSILDTLIALWNPEIFDGYVSGYQMPYVVGPSSSLDPAVFQSSFLLSEYDLIFLHGTGKPYSAYNLKSMRQAAYLDALDHVPQLNDNMLGNMLELVSFIKGIVIDHRVEIPRSLQSAWLAYRYSYGTTKLDMEEAISFVHRHVDEDFLARGFSCFGRCIRELSGTSVTVKCRVDMRKKEMDYLNQIWTALYRYGLSPSFYVVWDMIPYSFIVDWFIPVGDILSGYDTTRMYDRTYDISNIWFSCQYNFTVEGNACKAYTRWREESLPEFQGYYVLDNKGTTSNKVIGYRILDALSLLIR